MPLPWRVLLFATLVGCPKKGDLGSLVPAANRPSFNPDDPALMAVVGELRWESGLVLDCFDPAGPAGNTCAVPVCEEAPCPTLRVLAVAAIPLAAGPVVLPYGVVDVSDEPDGPCVLRTARPAAGVEPRLWAPPGRVVTEVARDGIVLPGDATPAAAWDVDLDGDGDLERIVEGVAQDGGTIAVVYVDGVAVVVAEDVVVEVPDDADDQARMDAELQRSRASIWGLTDDGLDGVLEVVTEGEAYEAWWSAVLAVETGAVVVRGNGGCAL